MNKKIAQVECQQGQEWAHYTLAYRLIKLQSCFIDTILKHMCITTMSFVVLYLGILSVSLAYGKE